MVGALGAVGMATVWVEPLLYAAIPALPASSAILVKPFKFNLKTPLPLILLMLILTLLPDAADTLAIFPVAVPDVVAKVKSSMEILLTDSLKLAVKAMLESVDAGVPLSVIPLRVGAILSTVALVVSAVVLALPALSVALKEIFRLVASIAPATMV